MAATRLLLLAGPRPRCLRIDERGGIIERLWPTAAAPLPAPAEGERTVLAVPGAYVRATRMQLDARSEAQARAAARAHAAAAAADGSDLHVALPVPGRGDAADGDGTLVLVTSTARMREWLAVADALAGAPDAVVPDYMLLPAGNTPMVVEDGDAWLVRGGAVAFTAEGTLARHLLADGPMERVAAPDKVEQVLAAGAIAPVLPDLLQGDFAPGGARRPAGSWRRVAMLATLLACSPLLLVLAEGIRDRVHAAAGKAIHAGVASRLGIAHAPGAAAEAIASERALLAAADRHATDVGALFAAVQARPDAGIERLAYDTDGFEAVVRHRGAESGQAIVAALQSAGLEVDAAAGATVGEDTLTTLRMRRLP